MAEDNSSPDALGQLVARLEHLERLLQMHTGRLSAVEQQLGLNFQTPDVESSRPPRAAPFTIQRDAAALDSQPAIMPPPSSPPAETFATTARVSSQRRRVTPVAEAAAAQTPSATPVRDVEAMVGGSWFNWIGIIAITFGVAFFLKYAFESEWVGPAGRVALGGAAGVGILAAGAALRRRGLRQYAHVLSGGGILILYLSVYAAREFYRLIEQPSAFLLMTAVTGTAVLLAARYHALPIAVLGLIGGFLTPVLLATGVDNQLALFTYIALLDLGVLALAYFKSWRSLNYMAFAATVLMFAGWGLAYYGAPKLWLTVFFLTLFFLLFALLAVVHNVLARRAARWFDVALVSLNATFYFGVSYMLLKDAGYAGALGLFALAVAGLFLILFYVASGRYPEDRLLVSSYLGAAITFLTIALGIQFEQQWVTMGWAMEGLMLTWVSVRTGERAPRYASLIVFAIAIAHWFGADLPNFTYETSGAFVPIFNRRALSCAVLVSTLVVSARLHRNDGAGIGVGAARETEESNSDDERPLVSTLLMLTANLLALALLTFDLSDYFTHARDGVEPGRAGDIGRIENARQFSLSALWTLYGTMMLVVGIKQKMKALRYVALSLLVGAAVKVLMFDLAYYAALWHVPIVNHTFMAFAFVACAFLFAARFYTHAVTIGDDERAIVPVLVVIANVLWIIALSAEAAGYFESAAAAGGEVAGRLRDLRLAEQLALSVIWAAYGGAVLVYGRLRNRRMLRLLALGLLALTALKVFFWDLSSLDRVYRIISFIVLGAVLLAVSYLYQRSQQQLQQREAGELRK